MHHRKRSSEGRIIQPNQLQDLQQTKVDKIRPYMAQFEREKYPEPIYSYMAWFGREDHEDWDILTAKPASVAQDML